MRGFCLGALNQDAVSMTGWDVMLGCKGTQNTIHSMLVWLAWWQVVPVLLS